MSEFISLYSGSSGNSSVVRCGERYLIIDMGKGVRTTSAALKALDLNISDCAGILVTHEMQFARAVANRVLFLDGGRIVEEAAPAQFFDHPQTERAKKFLNMFTFDAVK